jgi:predicted nucleic acid-binding protein
MANAPKRVYWDACAWIAYIQKEKIRKDGRTIEDREQMCREVLEAAKKGSFEIATSALTYVEVCKEPTVRDKGSDKIAQFFENDYILPVNLDRLVGERARELMLKGFSKLKPPDAVHLASASLAKCEEMHTFDDKLLALDGQIGKPDGTKLRIRKPSASTAPAPLLDKMRSC